MTGKIREEILAIRAAGKTNMLDTKTVQRIAFDMGFYATANYIETDVKAYVHFILTGRSE